jgi:hypothetical protein
MASPVVRAAAHDDQSKGGRMKRRATAVVAGMVVSLALTGCGGQAATRKSAQPQLSPHKVSLPPSLAVILTAGIFLIPFGIGSWLAKRLGRPWSGASLGSIISFAALGIVMFVAQGSVYNSPDYTPQQANDAASALVLAGLGFLCFAGILLMLKIREARRVHLYGYDASPWTLRHLWSWTIFVVPLLLSFFGVFSVFAAMTGTGDTPQTECNRRQTRVHGDLWCRDTRRVGVRKQDETG